MRGTRAMLLFAAGAAASVACVSTLGPRFGGGGGGFLSVSASVALGRATIDWEPAGDVSILVDAGPAPGPGSTRFDVSGSSAEIPLPPGTWYVVLAPRDGDPGPAAPVIELRALAIGTAGLTPLATPSTTLAGEEATLFGVPVVGAGDINGDGLGDVVLAAPYDDVAAENTGTWFVHLGTASGLVAAKSFETSGSEAFGYCGIGIAAVGNKGGSAGADVVIGCPGEGVGNPLSTVEIHYGTPAGTLTRTGGDWSIPQANQEDSTGHKILFVGSADALAGADLLVARISADVSASNAGRVSFYSCAGTSFLTTPAWDFDGGTSGSQAGLGMAAGDFDGDGRNEIAVGEPGYNLGNGRVVLLEAEQAASTAVLTTAFLSQTNMRWGEDLAALDYDGDGIDDLAIGSRRRVSLHRGRPGAMPSGVASWLRERPDTSTQFGLSIAGGDVNGDGYDDLLIGERLFQTNVGRVYLQLGGPGGPATVGTSWSWSSNVANGRIGENVAMIGDVNGDGVTDLAVSGSGTDAGDVPRVHVFLGPPREGPQVFLVVGTAGGLNGGFADADVANLHPHTCSVTADGVPLQVSCTPKVENAIPAASGALVRYRVTNAWGLAGETVRIAP